MNIFSIDGKLFKTLVKAGDFFILGFLGFVFSLPVITMGASLTAMFYVGMKLVRDEEGYVFRGFIKSWKQNLRQSIVIELIAAVIAALLIVDIKICYDWARADGSTFARLLMFGVIGIMVVLAAIVLYVFPMLAKFDNTIRGTIKNALLLCMHHFPQTIVMLFATGGLIYFSLYYFTAFIVTIPLICYIDSYILARVFLQYTKKNEEDTEEEFIAEEEGIVQEEVPVQKEITAQEEQE